MDLEGMPSKIGSVWLDFVQRENNIELSREYRISNYYVDGLPQSI